MPTTTSILFAALFFVSAVFLYLSVQTRPQEFELLGVKYGQLNGAKKGTHTFYILLSLASFLACFGGFVWYLVCKWNQVDNNILFVVYGLCGLICYVVLFSIFDAGFKAKRDSKYCNEIRDILSKKPVYQAIINKVKSGNFQTIYITSDGVAFYKEKMESKEFPETEVEKEWMTSYDKKYINLGKNSIIAATKRRCKEWEANTKKAYSSVKSSGCDDFVLFSEYGYDGISYASKSDIHRYMCKDIDFKEESITISQPFFNYYYESSGGTGTVNGSMITYSVPGAVAKKTVSTAMYTYTVLIAKKNDAHSEKQRYSDNRKQNLL